MSTSLTSVGAITLFVEHPRGMRTASFTDPDGHIWEIAQRLPESGDS